MMRGFVFFQIFLSKPTKLFPSLSLALLLLLFFKSRYISRSLSKFFFLLSVFSFDPLLYGKVLMLFPEY